MVEFPKDILQEIPNEDLPKLANLYENSHEKKWACYMLNFIKTAIRWKNNSKFCDAIEVFSPINREKNELYWKDDGTIIIIVKRYCYDIFIFTLNNSCEALYQGLKNTERIDWTKRVLFFAVHEKHFSCVSKLVDEKNLGEFHAIECILFEKKLEEALQYEISCPLDVEIRDLEPKHAKIINEVWPHKYPESEKYLAMLIEANGGYGVFLKETNQLVCWVVRHIMHMLGMLQSAEEYKRRGYAKLITKVISRELAKDGFQPVATVLVNNTSSIKLFESLNYKNIGKCVYFKKEK